MVMANVARVEPHSLEERVEIIAKSEEDKIFIKNIIKNLPYYLVNGEFRLAAERTGSKALAIYPYNILDKISHVAIPGMYINMEGNPGVVCSFSGEYINFRDDNDNIIRIERIKEGSGVGGF